MAVQSYLELYTTLIGWTQYQNLWEIMTHTGLIYLPFLGIVVSNFVEPIESQEPKSASATSLKRMEIQLMTALIVITLAAQPMMNLNPSVLNYVPVCSDKTKTAMPGNSGTTYDEVFPTATSAKVPVWWYAVMAVSSGITRAAMKGINCTANLRDISLQLNTTRITDPELRDELNRFYGDCFVPARSKYFREQAQNDSADKKYEETDSEWLGSHLFLETDGYYNLQAAASPVKGFAYDAKRDFDYTAPPAWGRPSCQEWWTNTKHGLKQRLTNTLPKPVLAYFRGVTEEEQDNAIKTLVKHNTTAGYVSVNNDRAGATIASAIGSTVGVNWEQVSFYPKLYLIIEACPIIQALLLMAIYMLLAIAIPFSRYRINFIIIASCAIFAVEFWSYLWHVAAYVDEALMKALYPVHTVLTDLPYTTQGILADMIVGSLYVGLPLILIVIFGWIGIQVGHGISSLIHSMSAPAMSAGASAGNLASSAMSRHFRK